MQTFLIVAVLGLATGQPLFFRPQQQAKVWQESSSAMKTLEVDWVMKQSATQLNDVPCGSGGYYCPDDYVCCPKPAGGYSCCPQPYSVCCSDGEHCCLAGTKCDVSTGTCNTGVQHIEWGVKQPAKQVWQESSSAMKTLEVDWVMKQSATQLNDVPCGSGGYYCPDDYVCCPKPAGGYSCCPQPYPGNQVKDGSGYYFPYGTVCCSRPTGGFGCCPQQYSVCCSDGEHCCLAGTKCDVSTGTCNTGVQHIEWGVKQPAKQVWQESSSAMKTLEVDWVMKQSATQLNDVPCGSGGYYCPDDYVCCPKPAGGYSCCPQPYVKDGSGYYFPYGSVCCSRPTGGFGCCPQQYSVCCSDGEHCCLAGTKCDVSTGTCNTGVQHIEWGVKQPAKQVWQKSSSAMKTLEVDWVMKQSATQLNDVPCGGGGYYCPDDYVCCEKPAGRYSCCPQPYSVCCSDGEHCCLTKCDVSTGTCNAGVQHIEWGVKQPAQQVKNVPCDVGYYCQDGYNCCPIPTGGYGCCPVVGYPVCCIDGIHCCPQGTTCNLNSTLCNNGDKEFESVMKIPARQFDNVICPDGQSECPSGNTCCKMASGKYGCCPYPKAVCCADKEHCCPNGETCNLSSGTCQAEVFIEWIRKTPGVKITKRKTEKLVTP